MIRKNILFGFLIISSLIWSCAPKASKTKVDNYYEIKKKSQKDKTNLKENSLSKKTKKKMSKKKLSQTSNRTTNPQYK
jgi:hypothetical protein